MSEREARCRLCDAPPRVGDLCALHDDFVSKCFAAKDAGFERICLTCAAGFNGESCPACNRPAPAREWRSRTISPEETAQLKDVVESGRQVSVRGMVKILGLRFYDDPEKPEESP